MRYAEYKTKSRKSRDKKPWARCQNSQAPLICCRNRSSLPRLEKYRKYVTAILLPGFFFFFWFSPLSRKEAVDGPPRLDESKPGTDDEDDNRNATTDEEKEEEEDDDDDDDVNDKAAQHEYIEQHGPFTPPQDWLVEKPPASTEEEWADLQNKKSFCRDKFWKGKKHGHLWSNGWAVATYKKKYKNKHYFSTAELRRWSIATPSSSANTALPKRGS